MQSGAAMCCLPIRKEPEQAIPAHPSYLLFFDASPNALLLHGCCLPCAVISHDTGAVSSGGLERYTLLKSRRACSSEH